MGASEIVPRPMMQMMLRGCCRSSCRFADIKAAKIAESWTQLMRLIDEEGFPVGCLLSARVRAWRLDDVTAWLATSPTERKQVPNRWRHQRAAESEKQP